MIKLEDLKKEISDSKFMTTFIVVFIIFYIFVCQSLYCFLLCCRAPLKISSPTERATLWK